MEQPTRQWVKILEYNNFVINRYECHAAIKSIALVKVGLDFLLTNPGCGLQLHRFIQASVRCLWMTHFYVNFTMILLINEFVITDITLIAVFFIYKFVSECVNLQNQSVEFESENWGIERENGSSYYVCIKWVSKQECHAGSGSCRIGLLCFMVGWRKRRVNQDLVSSA